MIGTGWVTLAYVQPAVRFDLSRLCDNCAIWWYIHLGQQRTRAEWN